MQIIPGKETAYQKELARASDKVREHVEAFAAPVEECHARSLEVSFDVLQTAAHKAAKKGLCEREHHIADFILRNYWVFNSDYTNWACIQSEQDMENFTEGFAGMETAFA